MTGTPFIISAIVHRQSAAEALRVTEGVLARVGDVEESVLILVLFVDAAHESGSGRQNLIDEDEDGLLGRELDPLTNNVDELAYGQVGRNKILLLIDRCDVALLNLLADDGNAVGVLLSDALGLGLALLEGVLVLELAAHLD
jgi:hypothetical protein